jgi:hypothetical protein
MKALTSSQNNESNSKLSTNNDLNKGISSSSVNDIEPLVNIDNNESTSSQNENISLDITGPEGAFLHKNQLILNLEGIDLMHQMKKQRNSSRN